MRQLNTSSEHGPGLIMDMIQLIIVSVAAISLALDNLGLVGIPWLRQNLLDVVFITVCALIVTSILERRFVLKSFHDKTNERIRTVEMRITQLTGTLSGSMSGDVFLKDRSEYEPMEIRMKGAKEIYVVGASLTGFVGIYKGSILSEAQRGCVFKFIVSDPSVVAYHSNSSVKDLNRTLAWLFELQKSTVNKIEVYLTKTILHQSIIAIDCNTDHGRIQVELYPSPEAGIRPHFDLRSGYDPKWYSYYSGQIEKLRRNSRPL